MDNPIRTVFDAAVQAVSGAEATCKALQDYSPTRVYIAAVGKAAGGMVSGALSVVGDRLVNGLVISKYDHLDAGLRADPRLHCIESAHPVPDQNSLLAGEALISFVSELPAGSDLLFLLSGGASALIEALPVAMTLEDLQRVNNELLATGLDINRMNQVRRRLSRIKGGRLAAQLQQVNTLQLLISDVPGDELAAIGSGPLVPAGDSTADETPVPEWLAGLTQAIPPPPASDDSLWEQIDTQIVASNAIACAAAVDRATELDLAVVQGDGVLTGDVVEMAATIAAVLNAPGAQPGVYIWGGETTVVLPESPGRGGRNQQLALQLVLAMPEDRRWDALCCGTDGSDGPTADAGGLVSQATAGRGRELDLDAARFAAAANAGEYLEKVNALVTTGPSGTNVMDLVVAILY
ncbi:MAG: DUF4147 domain-containing protein [Gammaproteobacteria bacterium]|nr:DUF4147 domain-containing protein [Gammaproteobacteria bacterium]